MKKNILMRTNLLVCVIVAVGFLCTAALSYRANYSESLETIEQVSDLTSEGIFHRMNSTFTKPVNISLTMANDSFLKEFLSREAAHLEDQSYIETLREYLDAYQKKYSYDAVFLVSAATGRYYNFNGLDRVLKPGEPENVWYYNLLASPMDYDMNVDNDEVAGAENKITVFVNCKIRNENGTVIGIVGVGVRIASLQELLQEYQDNFNINAYLIANDGTIEISTGYTGYEAVNLFDIDGYDESTKLEILNWRAEGMAHSFWTADQMLEKQNYLVARYLPELGWHLVVERDTGKMLTDLRRQLSITVIIICVILLVILLIITNVIRSFNRQIVSLTRTVEQERRTMFEKATQQLYENILELDITHNRSANDATEKYFESLGAPAGTPYDKVLRIVAEKQIREEFRQGYLDTFMPENVMEAYRKGLDTLRYDFMITKDGASYYWMRITARIVRWESDGSIHLLTYRQNIDAEKQREKQMRELAQTDEMTGLLTKTATQRRIDALLTEMPEQAYALYIFDIDNFKQANDQHGHAFGDEVIRAFCGILRSHFQPGDLLGRVGGDEFVAFIPVGDENRALEKAGELSAALNLPFSHAGKSWRISASIGVAFAPGSGRSYDDFYQNADTALYQTKKRGKNGFTLFGSGEPPETK